MSNRAEFYVLEIKCSIQWVTHAWTHPEVVEGRDDTGLENAHIVCCETGYELVPLVKSLKIYCRFCFSQNGGRKKHFTERQGSKMSYHSGAKSLKFRCFPAQSMQKDTPGRTSTLEVRWVFCHWKWEESFSKCYHFAPYHFLPPQN